MSKKKEVRKKSGGQPHKRIPLLDALRGLSILLMVAYHAGYDLVAAGYLAKEVLYNPLLDTLQTVFAALFIVLAGVSSRFSRSNLRRGLLLAGAALLVSAASLLVLPNPVESLLHALRKPVNVAGLEGAAALKAGLIGIPVTFGILHFLAVCILLYTLLEKCRLTVPFTLAMGFVCLYYGIQTVPDWLSSDYFNFVPWFFLFVLGTWLGGPIRDHKLPRLFYDINIPLLPAVGRHTLLIYLLHQPLLFGVLWVVGKFA